MTRERILKKSASSSQVIEMSRSKSTTRMGYGRFVKSQKYADLLFEEIPSPNEEFERQELDSPVARQTVRQLYDWDILQEVDRREGRVVYQLDEQAYQIAQDTVGDRDPMLPCEHSGQISLRDGRGFVCSFQCCPKVWSREEIEQWRDHDGA